jgi:hypothetical protein
MFYLKRPLKREAKNPKKLTPLSVLLLKGKTINQTLTKPNRTEMYNTRSTKTYKFRCECKADADLIMNKIQGEYKTFIDEFYEMEVELITNKSISDIIAIMRTIPDTHTACETIMPVAEYTGIRNYNY